MFFLPEWTYEEGQGILFAWKDGLRVNLKVVDSRTFKLLDIATALARQDVEKRAEALQEA